jgi:hypothetical protein
MAMEMQKVVHHLHIKHKKNLLAHFSSNPAVHHAQIRSTSSSALYTAHTRLQVAIMFAHYIEIEKNSL